MANIHDDPTALKALQDDIYRERILRARKMTVEERLADVFAYHYPNGIPSISPGLRVRELPWVSAWVCQQP